MASFNTASVSAAARCASPTLVVEFSYTLSIGPNAPRLSCLSNSDVVDGQIRPILIPVRCCMLLT